MHLCAARQRAAIDHCAAAAAARCAIRFAGRLSKLWIEFVQAIG